MAGQLGLDVTGVLGRLDVVRATILGRTLRVPALRELFHRRPDRLALAFTLNTLIMLPLAVWQPLFLLAAGPLVFGLAHLGATVRFSCKAPTVVFALLASVAAIRLFHAKSDNFVELVGVVVLLLAMTILRKVRPAQLLAASALLSPLFLASAKDPVATIQFLIIAHNFVAFFFWIRAAARTGETRTPVVCLAAFAAFHLFIWTLPVPRFETAYAFGQATHYFVWLRAIPEQNLTATAPVSFRRSWKLLERDFGRRGALLAVTLVLALSETWLLVTWDEARRLYFAVAAFHGYAEISMLALAAGGRLTRA